VATGADLALYPEEVGTRRSRASGCPPGIQGNWLGSPIFRPQWASFGQHPRALPATTPGGPMPKRTAHKDRGRPRRTGVELWRDAIAVEAYRGREQAFPT